MPELSGSVDSLADEEAIEFESDNTDASTAGALDISHPKIARQDSIGNRSRGRERHITPDDLEKMVITIKEKKDLEPLEFGTHSYLAPLADSMRQSTEDIQAIATPEITSAEQSSTAVSESASNTSGRSTTSIVRGFSPSHISSSYRSIPLLSAPESAPKTTLKPIATRQPQAKRNNIFALGASSGEDSLNDSSIEAHMQQAHLAKKKPTFKLGGSSGDDDSSLPSNMQSSMHRSSLANSVNSLRRPAEPKKTTSFKEEVATRTIHEDSVLDDDVFEDTEDEDDIDESAIDDDDDSSEWEDSAEDSNKSSIDEKTFFQRVDSRPNLTSRRSLITTMLHQKDRASALANAATYSAPSMQRSRTSSPNGPSLACSPESDDAAPLMMRKGRPTVQQPEIPRSTAQPIKMTATGPAHEAALSPKTTRRQMLSNELTQSLRRHLLWERQQKNQTATALKRRHTAHENLGNLKQFPDKVHMGSDDKDVESTSWNQYFGQGLGEYHSKGW